MVFLIGLGMGALIEEIEFVGNRLIPDTSVGDYVDNARDLIANSIGALLAVVSLRGWGLVR